MGSNGDCACGYNTGLISRESPLKLIHHGCQKTPQLCLRKTLSNAASGAVKECQQCVVTLCAPGVCRSPVFNPPTRIKLVSIRAPVFWGTIDCPRGYQDFSTLGNEIAAQRSVTRCDTCSNWYSWVESQGLVEDPIEDWKAFKGSRNFASALGRISMGKG